MRQDDPKKCTAAKIVRLGYAASLRRLSHKRNTVILDPYAKSYLLSSESHKINAITAIDCSWRLALKEFRGPKQGMSRKLLPFLAGNPVNYSKMHKLTTVEAIAGALFVLGHGKQAKEMLARFSWGHTFYELNAVLISEYASLEDPSKIPDILHEYGLVDQSFVG